MRRTEDEDAVAGIDASRGFRNRLSFPLGAVLFEPPGACIKDKVPLLTAMLGGSLSLFGDPGSGLRVRPMAVDGCEDLSRDVFVAVVHYLGQQEVVVESTGDWLLDRWRVLSGALAPAGLLDGDCN